MATGSTAPAMLKTWMRACAIGMAALALYVFLSGSLSWWRLLLAVLLLACPILTLWLGWTYARPDRTSTTHDTDAKEISHES